MMENIFIVTDFSGASQNAGKYGVEMAKQFGANVFLFHAYQAPVQVPESYILYTTEDVWESAKELLKKEIDLINPGKMVNVEICGGEGLPSDAIISEARKRNADVIICGMKGVAKAFRKIFGSTTTALTRKSDIPLIVVPESASFSLPKNIALASEMDPETSPATVKLLQKIGERFNSKLSIVWVVNDSAKASYDMRFHPLGYINELKAMNPVFEFPSGSSIPKTLEVFIKEHSIDLMAIIPHKHDLLERFFAESVTREMIFHTDIPLLVLPQKRNTETNKENIESQLTEKH